MNPRTFRPQAAPRLTALALLLAPTLAHAAPEAAEYGGAAAGEPSPLQFAPPEAVWNLIVFVALVAFLWKFVWPAIRDGLNAREAKIHRDLKAAEDAAAAASASMEQYKRQLAEAQQEAQRIVDQARGAAEQVAAKIKHDAEQELTRMKERAAQDIAAARKQAVTEVYEQAAVLSTQIAGRILRRELNAADQQQLVNESLEKFRSAQHN